MSFYQDMKYNNSKQSLRKMRLNIPVPTTSILKLHCLTILFFPFLCLLSKLSEDNTVKLYDVSVCKEADSTKGKFKGTPRCMAPEVLRFELNDFKADIYSFGIMLWEIWFGQRAFDADRQHDNQLFINLVSAGGRPREYSWLGKPPPLWEELMEECWHGDPEKRPTAKECEQIVTKLSNEWSG